MIQDLFHMAVEREHSIRWYPGAILNCKHHLFLCGTYFTPIEMMPHHDMFRWVAMVYCGVRMLDRYWIPMKVTKEGVKKHDQYSFDLR